MSEMQNQPEAPNRARGCLKYGCLGCLVIVGVPAVVLSVVVLIGLAMGVPEPVRVTTEAQQELPVIGAAELPPRVGTGFDIELPDSGRGRIELEVSMATLEVVAGDPGEPLRLEADYDSASFTLGEDFIESADGNWTYNLSFESRLGWFRSIFKRDPGRNHLRLVVPKGAPLEIVGAVSVGESDLDLGGLWVRKVTVSYGPGSHRVRFEEPLAHPAEEVTLIGSVGELRVVGLGNASPSRVSIIHSVGEARVDLLGEWIRDASVSVTQSVGDLRITVPDNVNLEVSGADAAVGSANLRGLREIQKRQAENPLPENTPTLHLSIAKSVGELRIGP
jgi:hypothetical protein